MQGKRRLSPGLQVDLGLRVPSTNEHPLIFLSWKTFGGLWPSSTFLKMTLGLGILVLGFPCALAHSPSGPEVRLTLSPFKAVTRRLPHCHH